MARDTIVEESVGRDTVDRSRTLPSGPATRAGRRPGRPAAQGFVTGAARTAAAY
nr:hypothetical protein [Streptomyces antibioticus]